MALARVLPFRESAAQSREPVYTLPVLQFFSVNLFNVVFETIFPALPYFPRNGYQQRLSEMGLLDTSVNSLGFEASKFLQF
jgi:hypothetical protein